MSVTYKQLYKALLPIITKVEKDYQYLDLDKNKYQEIVVETIEKMMEEFDESQMDYFSSDFKIQLDVSVRQYLVDGLNCPQKFIEVMSNYIDKNLKEVKTPNSMLKELKKLSSVFERLNFTPSIELYTELLHHHAMLSNMVQTIVEANIKQIKSNNIEEITKDNNIILFILGYCYDNNIEIVNDCKKEEVDDDFYCNDAVRMYLNEIGKFPLLSIEEEKSLLYEKTFDEEARKKIIAHNLRLVVGIAKRYRHVENFDLLDLIQEGNIGLIKAVDKFSLEWNTRFSTYAFYQIWAAISHAIQYNSSLIHLPIAVAEQISEYKAMYRCLQEKWKRNPTQKEIAKYMKISIDKVHEIETLQQSTVSLNQVVNEEDGSTLSDYVADAKKSSEKEALNTILGGEIQTLFDKSNLKDREKLVLALQFGLGGVIPKTEKEIAEMLNVSRQRVSQISAAAFIKIIKSKYVERYANNMDNPKEALQNIEVYREFYSNPKNKYKSIDRVLSKEKKKRK